MTLIDSKKTIYAIAGPTASGKSELAIELALHLGGEVINCDSVQIYQGIEIATAKITREEMRGIPHHLIDYISPHIKYSAADWVRDAIEKIKEIEGRGKAAILAGGTGFYLRTLREPLFESPSTDIALRERFKAIHQKKGAEYLYRMLKRIDKAAADTLFPKDYVRSTRALEFYFQTGQKFSEHRPRRAQAPECASRIKIFALNPPREELYERINRRTEKHFASGLIEEVRALREAGLRDDTNALGAHSYRRACEYFRGERDLQSAIEESKKDVRHYAKRQMTWFRKETDIFWLNGFGEDSAVKRSLLKLVNTLV